MYLKTARIAEMDGLAVNASTPEMIEASAAGRTGCTAGNAAVKCFSPLSARLWLAPDGRPWGAWRVTPPHFSVSRLNRVAVACGRYCAVLRSAPLKKSTLMQLGYWPWEF